MMYAVVLEGQDQKQVFALSDRNGNYAQSLFDTEDAAVEAATKAAREGRMRVLVCKVASIYALSVDVTKVEP